jgi:hypothetical protein
MSRETAFADTIIYSYKSLLIHVFATLGCKVTTFLRHMQENGQLMVENLEKRKKSIIFAENFESYES